MILKVNDFLYRLKITKPNYFEVFRRLFSYTEKEATIKSAMEFVKHNELKGSYMEFGVYKGGSFISAYHQAQYKSLDYMKFYAFDSFKGLPYTDGFFHKNQYSCSIEDFKKNLLKYKVNMNKVVIVDGWFKDLKKMDIDKASIIYIDNDLYESARDALKFVKNYIQDGTLLIFDDWYYYKCSKDKGEQKAFYEWTEKYDINYIEFNINPVLGKSFILKDVKKEIFPK